MFQWLFEPRPCAHPRNAHFYEIAKRDGNTQSTERPAELGHQPIKKSSRLTVKIPKGKGKRFEFTIHQGMKFAQMKT